MQRKVWFNGNLIDEAHAKVSIYDSALMFGDTVFEMTRSFNKTQFMLREHLKRLYASMHYVHMPEPITIDEMEKACYEIMEANRSMFAEDDEHRLMINVTRGLLGIYENVVDVPKGPNVIIADFPLRWTVASMGRLFDVGINAVIPSQRAIPASLLEPKVKNRSRLHYLMANIEVSNYRGSNNWALLIDPDGYIAEGTGDNFFIIKGKTLLTPEPRNILRGISRDYIINTLADQLGYTVVETNIEPYDVYQADEAFMTGTPFCMLPVTKLNSVSIGTGQVGFCYKELLTAWSETVGVDIEFQIKSWANNGDLQSTSPTPYQFKVNT